MKKLNILAFVVFILLISCEEENSNKSDEISEASFSWSSESNKVSSVINFINKSDNATQYLWLFGDGETSEISEPSHIYKKQGDYEITLIAGEDINLDGLLNSLDNADSLTKTITIVPNHLVVELSIVTTSNWTIDNPIYDPVPNAVIKLFKKSPTSINLEEPDYTLTSDEDGKLMIYDEDVEAVCFIVENGDESNIVDGYLIGGVFTDQAQIDNWSYIENASVGSSMYIDLNDDNIVNNDDKTLAELITISLEGTYTKTVYLGK